MSAGRKINTKSKDWCTPLKYVNAARTVFGGKIELDPCSNPHSITDARVSYCLPDCDGLKETWDFQTIFVNPPYGRDKERGTSIADWIYRCHFARKHFCSEVIALVPVATNTKHWKNDIFGCASSLCFLADTRLKFMIDGLDCKKGAPMACAMVYWGDQNKAFERVFKEYGYVTK